MVMLIPEEKILILGDACNNATFLFDKNSLTVEEYRENLIQIQNRLEGRFDTTCLCHHVIWASKDMIRSVIEVCDTIMKDQADDVPFNFMGQQAFVAKRPMNISTVWTAAKAISSTAKKKSAKKR